MNLQNFSYEAKVRLDQTVEIIKEDMEENLVSLSPYKKRLFSYN